MDETVQQYVDENNFMFMNDNKMSFLFFLLKQEYEKNYRTPSVALQKYIEEYAENKKNICVVYELQWMELDDFFKFTYPYVENELAEKNKSYFDVCPFKNPNHWFSFYGVVWYRKSDIFMSKILNKKCFKCSNCNKVRYEQRAICPYCNN